MVKSSRSFTLSIFELLDAAFFVLAMIRDPNGTDGLKPIAMFGKFHWKAIICTQQ